MTKVYAYLARIKEQEKDVIAVPDGAGRALCVSSDKHWTLTREWGELHIIAPLVEEARWEQNHLDADTKAHRLDRQAATISELQGSFLRVERDRDEWRRAHAIVEAERDQARDERDQYRRSGDEWRECHADAVRERDEWRARAEAAEQYAQAVSDSNRDNADRASKAERERDAAEYAEAEMERERDEWKARTTLAVSYADIEKAVADWVDDAPEIVNEVWSLVSGSDPAVFVVRESDIAAVKVEQDEDGGWEANGDLVAMRQNTAEALRGWALGDLQMLPRYEAVARAIEAKVDPIMARTRELLDLAYPGDYAFTGAFETCRKIAEAEAKKDRDA